MEEGYEQRLKKLFVGGLNRETTDETLKDYFETYGELEDSVVIRDSGTCVSRGFGYVTFADYKCTFQVLQDKKETRHKIDNKQVDVKRAIPRDDSSSASHSKTKKIFIGGLKRDAKENDVTEEIERILKGFGKLVSIDLVRDKDSGESRGYGFMELDSEDSVDTLCCVKMINIKGKSAEVKKAEPKHKDSSGGRGRGRGRGGSSGGFGTSGAGTGVAPNMSGFNATVVDPAWFGTGAVGVSPPYGAYGGTFGGAAYGGYPVMYGQMATSFGPLRTGYGESINRTTVARNHRGSRGTGGRYKPY